MWPALYKEIVENNEESRLRASYLIVLGIIFSEDYMTQFLDHFIPNTIIAFRKAETKTEKQILANVCLLFIISYNKHINLLADFVILLHIL